jgi:hypothetical protein
MLCHEASEEGVPPLRGNSAIPWMALGAGVCGGAAEAIPWGALAAGVCWGDVSRWLVWAAVACAGAALRGEALFSISSKLGSGCSALEGGAAWTAEVGGETRAGVATAAGTGAG